jgi:4-hydroxy-tetrahydrodipicolinate synthase
LHDALFCESSPGPVKYVAELLGICSAETRLPICEISDDSKQKVKAAVVSVGLLN